jgi:hypothetical protein
MRYLDEFAGNEAGNEPVSLSIRRIVVHKHIVGVLASRR